MRDERSSAQPIVDFRRGIPTGWTTVNDVVMGGRSTSTLRQAGDGVEFSGTVSLANDGGFASVRGPLPAGGLAGASGVEIRVRGDGRRYRIRLRMTGATDGIAYQATFAPPAESWGTERIPFDAFGPTFRGRVPADAPPLDPAGIRQAGLMIADRQAGPFRLLVAWIGAHRDDAG